MGRKKLYGDELNPAIKELYENGKSLNQIRIALGVHPEVVKRKLISMGVDVRGKSEAMRNFHRQRKKDI